MGTILALLIFQQTYADTTWLMFGATLENTHFQKMVGAMEIEPDVKWSYVTGDWVECRGMTVADVDGVAGMEVVVGSCDNNIYCLNGATGIVEWSYPTGNAVYSSATVADVDGIDGMEVVVGSCDKRVYCLDGATGTVKWSFLTGDGVHSSPAVADVDGDDTLEVVVGSADNKVYCLDGVTGAVKWSYTAGNGVTSSPAIADIDGDDTVEVVVGSFDHKVYCLNGATGTIKWSYVTGGLVESSPAVANIDGVAGMEVVVGSWGDKVLCIDGVTGALKWSYPTGGNIDSSPALADVDADDTVEVVIGGYDCYVYCLNGATGTVKWSYDAGGCVHRGISVADLDGDVSEECNLEVLVPNWNTNVLACLNGENGSVLWTKQLDSDVHDITIADIDADGCIELVVGTASGHKIWALDDVGGASDCECGPISVEEKRELRVGPLAYGLEFRVTGRGVCLFTPNTISVNIDLYDVCGKLQQVIYRGDLSKGEHTFVPDMEPSGIYFAVLRVNVGTGFVTLDCLKITMF
jgi:outer membrane protein assembly factor BamB